MVPLKRMAEGETSRESSIDMYTLLRVEQITSRSLLCRTGNPALCSVAPWRGGTLGDRREVPEGGDLCILVADSHCCTVETGTAL